MAALEADSSFESIRERESVRTRYLLESILRQLRIDLDHLRQLPHALKAAHVNLQGGPDASPVTEPSIVLVTEDGDHLPLLSADHAIEVFRKEVIRFIVSVINGLDDPSPAQGGAEIAADDQGPSDEGDDSVDPEDPGANNTPRGPKF